MEDFYNAYYAAADTSPAHHTFCQHVFGHDLCQHGFADKAQLELLLQVLQLQPTQRVLEIGCGNGRITEYLSACTGAHFTGLDNNVLAIQQAQSRTTAKSERLTFLTGDINHLDLPPQAFDVVLAIDSIYFSQDYTATIKAFQSVLCPHGQMAIFYSYGREPWVAKETFPKTHLAPDRTPLALALTANGLTFRTYDLTRQDYALARRRQEVLVELRPQFETEGNLFIYDNRYGDALGISQAIEEGLHVRYLYHVFAEAFPP